MVLDCRINDTKNTVIQSRISPKTDEYYNMRQDDSKYSSLSYLRRDFVSLLLIVLSIILFANCLYWLIVGISSPILDDDNYRQPQTAVTVYWLLRGGPIVPYETPVLGYPWTIPFEFPFYQIVVAMLARAGVDLDIAGRIVSFSFFVLTLIPVYLTFRIVGLNRRAFLYFSVLFLACPLYIYWSRTFMIETMSLFFSALWLYLFIRALNFRTIAAIVLATFVGVVAVLSKATTFPAFAFIAFVALFHTAWPLISSGKLWSAARLALNAGMTTVLPLAIGLLWIRYTDIVKLRGVGGSFVTSSALTDWNYGTWESRFSASLWQYTLSDRIPHEVFGGLFLIAALLIVASLIVRRYNISISVCLVAFMLPILVFTHLHVALRYYQVANAIFLVLACALAVHALAERFHPLVPVTALIVLIGSQLAYFHVSFANDIRADNRQSDAYLLGGIIQGLVPESAAIIVIGDEWSSAIPYYARRRAVMMDHRFPPVLWETLVNRPADLLGSTPLGAVIDCGHGGYDAVIDLVNQFVASRAQLASSPGCRVLAASRS